MSRSSHLESRPRRVLWRALWLVVLLGHAPATWSALGSIGTAETKWSSLFLLSACNLFFLLEILFAPSIHLLRNRRSAVVFMLVVALLHVGVLEHAPGHAFALSEQQVWLIVAGAGVAVLADRLRRLLHRVFSAMSDLVAARIQSHIRRSAYAFVSIPPPRELLRDARSTPPRAPPRPSEFAREYCRIEAMPPRGPAAFAAPAERSALRSAIANQTQSALTVT